MRVLSIKFPCDLCDYKATWKGSLLRHIKSLHESVKFPCDQCNYKAAFKVNLLTHIKSKPDWSIFSNKKKDLQYLNKPVRASVQKWS